MTLNRFTKFSLSVGLLVAAFAGPAAACQGSETLFLDDFSTAEPAWGPFQAENKVENGELVVTPVPSKQWPQFNEAAVYEDMDFCADVIATSKDPNTSWFGLMFWGVDYNNYFVFQVSLNGRISVARLQKGKWLTPVPWQDSPAGLVKPAGETNALRVVVRGQRATLFLNGQQVMEFKGTPPSGGGKIGVYAIAGADDSPVVRFDNVNITSAPTQ
jgi:hypothetical protein